MKGTLTGKIEGLVTIQMRKIEDKDSGGLVFIDSDACGSYSFSNVADVGWFG